MQEEDITLYQGEIVPRIAFDFKKCRVKKKSTSCEVLFVLSRVDKKDAALKIANTLIFTGDFGVF